MQATVILTNNLALIRIHSQPQTEQETKLNNLYEELKVALPMNTSLSVIFLSDSIGLKFQNKQDTTAWESSFKKTMTSGIGISCKYVQHVKWIIQASLLFYPFSTTTSLSYNNALLGQESFQVRDFNFFKMEYTGRQGGISMRQVKNIGKMLHRSATARGNNGNGQPF